MRLAAIAWVGIALLLAACASTPSQPPRLIGLAADASRLSVDVSRIRVAPLKPHRFDPAAGLDPTDVAVLAVLNSPDLAARRADARIAAAQTFAAGLLPDPELALSADFPLHPGPAVSTADNINPSLNLIGIITHSAALKAARASERQADLDLLWAEWAAAQQARELAVTIVSGDVRIKVLEEMAQETGERARLMQEAERRGDVSVAAASADLLASQDARLQLETARHEVQTSRAELNGLIGLQPAVVLKLVASPNAFAVTGPAITRAEGSIADRRPDLLALRAGRDSQDANLRKALLARFPLINVGFSHQTDNSDITSNGPAATLVIPLFNGGRGDIAVARATRDSLALEYQARLDETSVGVAIVLRNRELARSTVARLKAQYSSLAAAADRGRKAAERGDLDGGAALALDEAAHRQQLAILDAQLALDMAEISLETILFIPADGGPQA